MAGDHTPGRLSRPLRSYGRRKGKPLSPRKQRLVRELLPQLRPDLNAPAPVALTDLFQGCVNEVWLEIGFGAGEHLLWQARTNPQVGIIGCEPFLNGVAALLGKIEDEGLSTIFVHDDDVRDLLAWLPAASIGRAFVLFPDPWPKKRQAKRRLVSPDFVSSLANALRPGGALRFASDDINYAEQALVTVNQNDAFAWTARRAADWRHRPEDWPETRYERKALSDGRKPAYLQWCRL